MARLKLRHFKNLCAACAAGSLESNSISRVNNHNEIEKMRSEYKMFYNYIKYKRNEWMKEEISSQITE